MGEGMTKTVTVERAQLEQWLEALNNAQHFIEEYAANKYVHFHNNTIAAIKEALAQPEQDLVDIKELCATHNKIGYKHGYNAGKADAQRKPMEGVIEIKHIGYHSLQLIFRSQTDIAQFKAAHGIKGGE